MESVNYIEKENRQSDHDHGIIRLMSFKRNFLCGFRRLCFRMDVDGTGPGRSEGPLV